MQTPAGSKAVEQVIAAIQALDLEPIKVKLMDREEGQGWSREYVDRMEIAYRRFLTLSVKYPEETIAPSKDVDKFWHGHILDTMKYAEDCENVFGYFLHHFPYFGMRGEEDAANLAEAGRTTNRLYEREFGEPVSTHSSMCGAKVTKDSAAMCGAKIEANPAMCGAKIASRDKLNTAVRPRLVSPAMCGARIQTDAAMCGATVAAAMCGAAKPAMCGAAKPAMCGAAVTKNAAMCGVAKPAMCGTTVGAAMCGVAKPAMCGAAKPAMCGATVKANAAMCGTAKPAMCGTAVRPQLPLAA